MTKPVFFTVDPRLASLLGETYRSTEVALKELVDNAWDADADNVWITLPKPLSTEPIIVRDDGVGMNSTDLETEYLKIASDPRSRRGERSPKYKRRVKGRKGIGKFAGLATAQIMRVSTTKGGQRTTIEIDRDKILRTNLDLEKVPLSTKQETAALTEHGTIITLLSLNQNLHFPDQERMRAVLVHEYGRNDGFQIYVNDSPLTVEDIPGPSTTVEENLSMAGEIKLHLTIADGKKTPRQPGIVIKVAGKTVGKPGFFGLEDDERIPAKLLKRIYGEVEVDQLEDHVTADWGSILENSKPLAEVRQWVSAQAQDALTKTYKREIDLQKARLARTLKQRLEKLPEHRRSFAEEAISRILHKFYGIDDERINTIADVVLDAMEHDEYWTVLREIGQAKHSDVSEFAESLEHFGLLELALVSRGAKHRLSFLDNLDILTSDSKTLEKDVHRAIEHSLWVLGAHFHTMASNITLKRIVDQYCGKKFSGKRGALRPDLLLARNASNRHVLVEFKRPSHPIDRNDEAQAQVYRDELSQHVPGSEIDILVIGGRRAERTDTRYDAANLRVLSYNEVISNARYELDWLLKNLKIESIEQPTHPTQTPAAPAPRPGRR